MTGHTIRVSGMSCRSCEILLEDELSSIEGVERVSADAVAGEVVIHGVDAPLGRVKQAIAEIGYTVRE